MYKRGLLIILLCISLLLNGCAVIDMKKPSYNFYTLGLSNVMKSNQKSQVKVTDMNYHKSMFLEKEDISTIKNLLTYLKKNNYVTKSSALPTKPQYKIFFYYDSNEYIMNVYDTKYISLFPYDGNYDMDYIDTIGTYNNLNVFNLCKYIFSKK